MSGLGLSGYQFLVSSFLGFQVWEFDFRLSSFRFRVWVLEFRFSSFEFRFSSFGL